MAAISLIFSFILLVVTAAAVADNSRGYAACAALRALADLERSELDIVQREARDVDSMAADGHSPIAVGETLNAEVALHLEGALSTLRHALAAGAFQEATEIAEYSALDGQLNAMLIASSKEPLFYWHGPRRLMMPRLQTLLQSEGIHQRLKATAADCSAFVQLKGEIEDLVGRTAPAAEKEQGEALEHSKSWSLPRLGIAVGDLCDAGGTCDVKGVLDEVGRFNAAGKVHVMVLPSSQKVLNQIGTALRDAADVWMSILIPADIVAGHKVLLYEALKESLAALGKKRLDLCWLPYEAFPKAVWAKVKPQLQRALKEGLIGAYGVSADIGDARKAKGLFEDRQPAPIAWLAHHDVLQPAHVEAVAIVRKLGMPIVALPRAGVLTRSVVPAYLEAVAGTDAEQMTAHHHSWVLQRGFGLVLEVSSSGGPVQLSGVLQRLPEITLSKAALQLLDNVQLFSRPHSAAVAGENTDGQGLAQNLQEWRRKASQPSAAASANVDFIRSSSKDFIPGLTKGMLDDLPKQAKEFKENFKAIYRPNFFDEATFAAIQAEAKRLWQSTDIEGNCNLDGRNRVGGYVLDHTSKDTSLYKLIYGNEDFRRWVTEVNGEGPMYPSDFPIELREYPADSKGMGCHPDLQMYAVSKKDNEFAFTVDNFSKCNVTFYDLNNVMHTIETKANSMMMVGVNSATHCVSRTDGGYRTIIKFIYVGDYRKSKSFEMYKGNECGPENPNNRVLQSRRDSAGSFRASEL